jgi:hypothetical protein
MKKLIFAVALVAVAWGAAAQAALPTQILGPGLNSGRTNYIQGWDRTLSADTLYILTGLYYVDSTYTLTIPAGTVIQGDTAATLIVRRGAQIFAEGDMFHPIVMTSLKTPGNRAPGDWGGVVILGKAPVNKVEPLIEGGLIFGSHGGNDPHDSSGVFKYVRIEFCGYRFQLDNEINGLTMGSVGDGTELHHVQVSYAFDDGFEWFGGTVNAHHLVVFGGTDDEFDTDFGYRGKVQFAFGLRDEFYSDPTGQSNGFESDNDGSSTSTATPYTRPVFTNVTLVGPERTNAHVPYPLGQTYEYSQVLRRSTQTSTYNSVIMGYPWGLSIRDATTQNWATLDTLQIRNTSIQATLKPSGSTTVHDQTRWANVATWFNTVGYNNLGSAQRNPDDLLMEDLSDLADPRPIPQAGSELIGSADFSNPRLAGCEVTTYRGAFDPTLPMNGQWTRVWTNFDPQNADYDDGDVSTGTGDQPAYSSLLGQNYPNPFNPQTSIDFIVPAAGTVSLQVFNARGQLVKTLVAREMAAGKYTSSFNADDLTSGVYFYRLNVAGHTETRKMTLLK